MDEQTCAHLFVDDGGEDGLELHASHLWRPEVAVEEQWLEHLHQEKQDRQQGDRPQTVVVGVSAADLLDHQPTQAMLGLSLVSMLGLALVALYLPR